MNILIDWAKGKVTVKRIDGCCPCGQIALHQNQRMRQNAALPIANRAYALCRANDFAAIQGQIPCAVAKAVRGRSRGPTGRYCVLNDLRNQAVSVLDGDCPISRKRHREVHDPRPLGDRAAARGAQMQRPAARG